jgi:hypothetical protein
MVPSNTNTRVVLMAAVMNWVLRNDFLFLLIASLFLGITLCLGRFYAFQRC